jgi:O-antigen/teichoic acid export membrane protein
VSPDGAATRTDPEPADGSPSLTGGRSPRTLARRIVTYAPSSVLPAALTLATSMIFTRIFSASAFGTYSLFLVIATPVKLILTSWVSQAVGKFVPQELTADGRQRAKDAVFLATAMVFCCETALGLVAVALSSLLLPGAQRAYITPMVAFVVLSSVFELLTVVLSAEHRAKDYTAFRVTDSVLTFLLRLLLVSAMFRMNLTLMFWSVAVSNGLLVPLMWVRVGLPRPGRIATVLRSAQARALVRAFAGFGLPMTIWYLSGILLDIGDRFVINAFLGPAAVGVYDANYRLISGTAILMVIPVTLTLHPYLMNISGSGDSQRISSVIGAIVEKMTLVGLLAVGLTALFSRDLATLLLGPQFREGHVIMPIVLAGVLFNNIGTFAHKPFEIVGRTRPMVVFGLVSAVANVAMNIALVPFFGYLGSAYATLLSYALYTACVGHAGRGVFPWRVDVRRVAGYTIVIVGALAAIRLLRDALHTLPAWSSLLVAVAASGLLAAWCLVGVLRDRPVTRPWAR